MAACREIICLVAHAEQMSFIVKIGFPFGSEEKGAIVIGRVFVG
jgi:hypothetical protein